MCGICGVLALDGRLDLPPQTPERMIGVMRHRGPDEFGAWSDEHAFLGHARLSIIDLKSGQQPLCNEDGTIWISFNGEIFNYIELAEELVGLGHEFVTRSDTEVIVHAYEQWGPRCVDRFNGQFAIAVWDAPRRRLFLARDRFGIRPLFLTQHDGKLLFASEIKALRAYPGLTLELAPAALAEVLTYWVNVPPNTAFAGVSQLPPGHTAIVDLGDAKDAPGRPGPAPLPACVKIDRYWHPTFLPAEQDRRLVRGAQLRKLTDQVRERLVEAAVIRLRADVPVGAYLSGGLDSSTTAALIHRYTDHRLKTFSVGFADADFDETDWQYRMAAHIGTEHVTVSVDGEAIAGRFAEVVRLAETPILRTAPAPLHALSGLAHDEDFKVVLTGEGADEVFVGYNIFREAKVRRFWSRDPASRRRSLLLTRLYAYLAQSPPEFLRKFYGAGLDNPDDPFFSHRPRWQNTGAVTNFLCAEATAGDVLDRAEARLADTLPDDFAGWGTVARAQYLEMTAFMAGYLLSSQGDRMLMGNSVEGRFPFLDHNLADFAGTVPAAVKLQSLVEKAILKQSVADLLPADILSRPKQPYRAPDSASFQGPAGQALVAEHLLDETAAGWDLWRPERIAALVRKWQAGRLSSMRDNQAFVAVLSGRILQQSFGPGAESWITRDALAPQQITWRSPRR